jgi:hypothetical protein
MKVSLACQRWMVKDDYLKARKKSQLLDELFSLKWKIFRLFSDGWRGIFTDR